MLQWTWLSDSREKYTPGDSFKCTIPRSAESAQSNRSLRYLHEETLGTYLPIERTTNGMNRKLIWVFAGITCHFVEFVMPCLEQMGARI